MVSSGSPTNVRPRHNRPWAKPKHRKQPL